MENSKEFKEGIIWSLGSIGILGLSGVGLNVLIGALYDASTLGVFNQVVAAYIFFSTFAVGGVNLSALKHISEYPKNFSRTHEVVISALTLTFVCSTVATAVFWYMRLPIARLLDSPGVLEGMAWITPGLFFFGLNKTLLGVVNGLHEMKAFAAFQSVRYLNLLSGFFIALWFQMPGQRLAFVFSFSEIFLFIALAIYLRRFWSPRMYVNWTKWVPIHLSFGAKGAFSGALLDLNSRVDILLLGYFSSDAHTGIYSFAALVYEGMTHFLVVLQNNYNPHLSSLLHQKRGQDVLDVFRNLRNMTYKYALILIPISILAYPVCINLVFMTRPEFLQSWLPFAVLMAGLLVSSGYIPFQNILVMSGHPGWHTILMAFAVTSNITFNVLLIPSFDLVGAALGTAMSLILTHVALVVLARRRLNLSLL